MIMSKLMIKRAYLPAEEGDGRRVLIDRLWPRGLSKDKARIDLWAKDIAPSNELRKWFGHDSERFAAFSQKYIAELDTNAAANSFAEAIAGWLAEGNVTLVFAAKDEEHNNAVVMQHWLEQK